MASGRPPVFNADATDCEFPIDTEATSELDGSRIESGMCHPHPLPYIHRTKQLHPVRRWRNRFIKEIATPIAELVCSAQPVKYSTVMELDQRIRSYGPHKFITSRNAEHRIKNKKSGVDPTIHPIASVIWLELGTCALLSTLRNGDLTHACRIAILQLHRGFFRRAIDETGGKPDKSPLKPSFVAAIRSAKALLFATAYVFAFEKCHLERSSPLWATFITCVVRFLC